MRTFCRLFFASLLCVVAAAQAPKSTFTNPLLPGGPDPWVEYKDGVYYYMNTTATDLTVWKTRDMADLGTAEKKVVWTPPATGPYSKDIWAPEIHFLRGKWYIYFAADGDTNQSHRIWVIENPSPDPWQGTWTLKGKVAHASDKWAIDASVFEDQGKLYMIWSGWEGDVNGTQGIYIARLKDPWTVEGPRARLSTPEYPWEKVGDVDQKKQPGDPPHIDVNEGPEILQHNGKIFLIYSASACWTDDYALGMLTANSGTGLVNPASWKKAVHVLEATAGACEQVSEAEIAQAKAEIGAEGIGCEPASAVTLAGLKKLLKQGFVKPEESVVLVLTGNLLKDPDYTIEFHRDGLFQGTLHGSESAARHHAETR